MSDHDSSETAPERREEERTKSQIRRTVPATLEFEGEDSELNHLYVEDISRNGLRVNLDRSLEADTVFRLTVPLPSLGFGLEGQLDSECRVVWSKTLSGGTCVLGLEFLESSDENGEVLSELIEHWKCKQDLNLENLQRLVDVKVRMEPAEPWSLALGGRALSSAGLSFHRGQPFPVGQDLEVRLLLEAGTIQSLAKVRWCEPMPNGSYDIGCELLGPSRSALEYIELHLRRSKHKPL